MEDKVKFYIPFKRKMLYLSLIAAILISFSMPLTYLVMGRENLKSEAKDHSMELALKLKEQVRENHELWQFGMHRFLQIFDTTQVEDINEVNIYNSRWELVRTEKLNNSLLPTVVGLAPVKYNNEVYGYVEVKHQTVGLVHTTLSLFLIFSVIGCVFGRLLYQYPLDIIKRAEREVDRSIDKLHELSYKDTLTALPNRRHFQFRLDKELQYALETNERLAVMFIDLDDFKIVNDSFGHGAGDLLLKLAGERLRNSVRKNDFVARLGGDEFVITLPAIKDEDEVVGVAERIIQELREPFLIEGNQLTIRASIGISIYPKDAKNAETLLANADIAMFKAKELGKSEYAFYV